MKKNLTHNLKKTIVKGFTMLELMVVVTIMAVITSIVLFNNRDLNSSILVSNTAYEINLLIREAQAYGLGVRGVGDTSTAFINAQGVFFDISNPDKVILFSDTNDNGSFTEGEEIQTYLLDTKRAGTILSICKPVDADTCEPVSDATVSILFKRPNPESLFMIGENTPTNGPIVINTGFSGEAQGMCRSIIVQKTGAVQVNTQYCF